MANYLSVDTEATGLEEGTHLIQIAFVPLDMKRKVVRNDLGVEYLVHCPSFESLKPTLSEWVIQHNKGLIEKAHAEGLRKEALTKAVTDYFATKEFRGIFGDKRPVLLGKSLSALDIPLITKYFGKPFFEKYFHHHTMDITSLAHFLVDKGRLPAGCESTSEIIRHFKLRNEASHTALNDATDMAKIYLALLEMAS